MSRGLPRTSRPRWRVRRVVLLASVLSLAASALPASASTPPLPAPGSAAQVAALVAASLNITSLPSHLLPSLQVAPIDTTSLYYPVTQNGCSGVARCVFGDVNSSKTVVLYGDSHAWMWLPALEPVALAQHFKLILTWKMGCPDVDVPQTAGCKLFRTTSIAQIRALHSALVLLDNRTFVRPGQGFQSYTPTQWLKGQEATITALKTSTTKVAIIEDTDEFTVAVPVCLTQHPRAVQDCTSPDPNSVYINYVTVEHEAAVKTGAEYVNDQKWLCTKSRCAAVIGTMVAYSDESHITATYAEYLANVWAAIIPTLM